MPISWSGFGPGVTNKTTLEEILAIGMSIDEDLAIGKRIVADLTQAEKRALEAYRNMLSKQYKRL